ncbi:D-ribose pyranase [Kineococcus rubinsiae]|uniref:D-ribose pyranase n=1 Tax=Kineococcus rubinsiae TaxID=2609562 RepID=UPI00142FFDB8|nr:D-ribose pyranase [Kineococcus rubinsiae]NIZ92812.1 D-ribose pyranase [Kineococcus rubinsiae]
MRRSGLVHAELLGRLTALRHTDSFAVSDSGLPVAAGIPVVDLGVSYGVPGFAHVLGLVLAEVVVEAACVATQIERNPAALAAVVAAGCDVERVDHEEFKRRTAACRFVVRTGEATPYANVLLRSGVPFA